MTRKSTAITPTEPPAPSRPNAPSKSRALATTDQVIDEIVQEINLLARQAPLQLSLSIGRLIIDKLYGGQLNGWRDHGPKDTSFQKLAQREDLPRGVNAVALYRSVAVYQIFTTLDADIATWKYLSISHFRAVIVLGDAKQQKKYLDLANQKQWTVDKLEEEIARKRPKAITGAGRRPLPAFVKAVHKLEKFVGNRELLLGDLEAIEEMGDDEVEDLRDTVRDMQGQLAILAQALEGR